MGLRYPRHSYETSIRKMFISYSHKPSYFILFYMIAQAKIYKYTSVKFTVWSCLSLEASKNVSQRWSAENKY